MATQRQEELIARIQRYHFPIALMELFSAWLFKQLGRQQSAGLQTVTLVPQRLTDKASLLAVAVSA